MLVGDSQKIWFPEVIDHLRSQWQPDMSFDRIVILRDELEATLQHIRSKRRIRSPRSKCPQCGKSVESVPHVSVRAMILSLHKFTIAPAEQAYTLEKSWAVHRREHQLDLYGQPASAAAACAHSQSR